MNPERLLNIPCTIHTVTESTEDDVEADLQEHSVDEYGDPTTTSSTTSTVCWVDRRGNQGDGTEQVGEANWQTDSLDLYLPAGTTITGNDRVTVSSTLYEVVGPPHEHLHPRTGAGVYVAARIRRVT